MRLGLPFLHHIGGIHGGAISSVMCLVPSLPALQWGCLRLHHLSSLHHYIQTPASCTAFVLALACLGAPAIRLQAPQRVEGDTPIARARLDGPCRSSGRDTMGLQRGKTRRLPLLVRLQAASSGCGPVRHSSYWRCLAVRA
jgi:hypothetical protein